ncbi:imm11 family protein [Bacterioplanoides sp.]|uniref:imm11 family protein n=1 Tax=Bacterioplanoides sp. TaxID=2066072 RepID=UPI003B005A62
MKYDGMYYTLEENFSETSELEWVNNKYRIGNFDKYKKLDPPKSILNLEIESDDDRNPPVMGDFASVIHHVWSQRARDIIMELASYRIQMFPAKITKGDHVFEHYYFMNCFDEIPAMHKDRSDYSLSRSGLTYFIESLSLDENVLDQIPEDQRMIFALEEKAAYYLYHEKVVNALKDISATGFSFVKVKDWIIGSAFD